MAMIGMVLASGRFIARIRRVASRPSITGIITSIKIASISPGLESAKMRTASSPFTALMMEASSTLSTNSAISIFILLSSATSTCSPAIELVCSRRFGLFCFSGAWQMRNDSDSVNVVPTPCLLTKDSVPPIFSARLFAIGIPRPVPPYSDRAKFRSCANGSNTCF